MRPLPRVRRVHGQTLSEAVISAPLVNCCKTLAEFRLSDAGEWYSQNGVVVGEDRSTKYAQLRIEIGQARDVYICWLDGVVDMF